MYFIYSFLLTLGFVLLLPRFVIDAFRSGKYVTGLSERLGRIPKFHRSDAPVVWLHCVSVGETEAARPLVAALRQHFPDHRIVISTTTVTGQEVACRAFASEAAAVFYFPIDWGWTVRRVLNSINPNAVLIMETELWPNLLRECHRRSIPVALVNGRISPKSFHRYLRIRTFMRRVLGNLTLALMQSEEDARRISELGVADERIKTLGNMKFDGAQLPTIAEEMSSQLQVRFALNADERLIVAASTHAPEETIVIEAFKRVKQTPSGKAARLLIAPRHPERFEEVAKLIVASGFTWSRKSAPASPADESSTIILLDSIGELRAAYQFADIAFIGGSLIPHGGQNVLEPAAQGVAIITGAHTHNFAAIVAALLAQDALIQLPRASVTEAPAALAACLVELLGDEERRKSMGFRGQSVCTANRGATQRTIDVIAKLLASRTRVDTSLPSPAVAVALNE